MISPIPETRSRKPPPCTGEHEETTMSPGQRPGGLTALAVLNFIFGGFALLGVLGWVVILGLLQAEPGRATRDEVLDVTGGPAVIYAIILLNLIQGALLVISGVGYLGQKAMMGKVLGNAYAVVTLAANVF